MERYLEKYIKNDLIEKIVLLSGPRQVGKTILSKQLISSNVCLNYDSTLDRKIICMILAQLKGAHFKGQVFILDSYYSVVKNEDHLNCILKIE